MGKYGDGKLKEGEVYMTEEQKHMLMILKDNPVALKEMEKRILAEQKLTKDQIEYKQFLKKIGDMAESKRNMKIDMRPRVFMRVMRLELFIFAFSATMICSLPLYFLKVRPYYEQLNKKHQEQQAKLEEERA